MKQYFKQHVLFLLLGCFLATGCSAQSAKANLSNKCEQQPFGSFAQITNSSLELSKEFYDTLWLMKDSDLRENRWTLTPLDEVDPRYQFLIQRSSNDSKEKCDGEKIITGKLVSPTGKLYDFKQAAYDFSYRKLTFTTIERDGINYEADVQFHPKPVFRKGLYQEGTLKLTAFGKKIGKVTMEFPFSSTNSE